MQRGASKVWGRGETSHVDTLARLGIREEQLVRNEDGPIAVDLVFQRILEFVEGSCGRVCLPVERARVERLGVVIFSAIALVLRASRVVIAIAAKRKPAHRVPLRVDGVAEKDYDAMAMFDRAPNPRVRPHVRIRSRVDESSRIVRVPPCPPGGVRVLPSE